jgi:hypothetical protein
MARIRSVHPGLFSDESWVSCSFPARLLFVGLWTDADDQGVFEWRPVQLKMRLLPNDAVEVSALLAELEAVDLIRGYEVAGKRFGAIKNFQKHQRPKKPNALFPLPKSLVAYVCPPKDRADLIDDQDAEPVPPQGDVGSQSVPKFAAASSEPVTPDDQIGSGSVGNQFRTGGENSQQMEDGGWRREEESPPTPPSVGASSIGFDRAWNAYPAIGQTKIDLAKAAYPEMEAEAGGPDAAMAIVTAYAASPAACAQSGRRVPSMHLWLKRGDWRSWSGKTAAAPVEKPRWTGPPDVRSEIVAAVALLRGSDKAGEDFAVSHVDGSAWRDIPSTAIVCRSATIAERLHAHCGALLRRRNIAIVLADSAGVAA